MNRIVWLASYPKSGNTWFRAFLANFLRNDERPVSINELEGAMASGRRVFDDALGYDSSDLSFDEIDALRPDVYRYVASHAKAPAFFKVHDAYTLLPDGQPMFPPEATRAVLYFVRNPLDVCVSFAHHGGHMDFDRMIRRMANPRYFSCDVVHLEANQFRMKFLSWSEHVKSWSGAACQRVLIVRYEDMKLRGEETFTQAVEFIGLGKDPQRIRKAMEFSRFQELQAQEQKLGFAEKMPEAKAFFRKGEIGSWREVLTDEQVATVIADHGDVMRSFGYLDGSNRPVF